MKKQLKHIFAAFTSLALLTSGIHALAETPSAEVYPYTGLPLSVTAFVEEDSISKEGVLWKTIRGTVEGELLTHGELRYHVYLPQNFSPSKKYPLVLYLHGSGAAYKQHPEHTPWTQTLNADHTKLADALSETMGECIIFAPHAPGGKTGNLPGSVWTRSDKKGYDPTTEDKSGPSYYLKAAVTRMHDYIENGIPYAENIYRVNTKRIYLIGDSAGAFGSYTLLGEAPSLFAAVMVRAGKGNPDTVPLWKDTPIRIFHGTEDALVSYESSTKMIEALRAAGAKDAELITYENAPHDIRYFAYQTYDEKGNNVYLKWLSEQSRTSFSLMPIYCIGGVLLFCICILVWFRLRRKR